MVSRKYRVRSILGLMLVVGLIAGCTGKSNVVVPTVPDEIPEPSPERMLLEDDFSGNEIGNPPADWGVSGAQHGAIEVVEDLELDSERAVRIQTDAKAATTMSIRRSFLDPPAGDFNRIVIQHRVKHGEGRGVNVYVNDGSHRLNWLITNGELGYRAGGDHEVATLEPGWNVVRLIADRQHNQVFVYLNDMDTPAAGPFPFRAEIASWAGADIIISHTTNEEVPSELFYGDVKVWGID